MHKDQPLVPILADSQAAKTEANQDEGVSRHPDLWFSDGSVVLKAEGTLFRVHISQLDAVELDGTFGGCPLLVLHDSAEDLSNLLKALYDGGPALGDNGRGDFRVVSGVLRLSTKYIIDSLRSRLIEHLSVAWPSKLRDWDARETACRSYASENSLPAGHLYPSPISVINLAREVDAPSLLPAAFYELSKYHFGQIFEPSADSPLHPDLAESSVSSTLSIRDLQMLAMGKESSQQAVAALITSMSTELYRDSNLHTHPNSLYGHQRKASDRICVSHAACRKDLGELVDLATNHYLFDREKGCSDPLYVAEELGSLKSSEYSECRACAKSLEGWATKEREKIWKLIPHWFRLDI